jgi:outer membrane protein
MVYYEQDMFYFRGNRVGYRLYKDQQFSIDLLAEWMFRGYDPDDSDDLSGMDDRDGSIEGGLSASYRDGWGVSTIRFVTDVLGTHHGQELTFSYGKPFFKRPWTLIPSVGVAFASRDLTNYYYGVRSDEAAPGRPQYSPGQSYYPFVGLTTAYRFNEKWAASVSLRCDWLDSDITNSPIVNKDYQIKAIGGLMYTF